ncbi:MAG: transglutaminase family protein [Ilumatobacteraceae bacterium]
MSTNRTSPVDPAWLASTDYIDADDPAVAGFAARATAGVAGVDGVDGEVALAVALFHAVRDGIRYDPYGISYEPDDFRASTIADAESNWCVPKSVLLVAAARHLGIPARLGFADVRNHLTSAKLAQHMGTDLFAWHGYAELLLPDPDPAAPSGMRRWFKLSSAFNIELCDRFGVRVLEFDGTHDALMHPYDRSGNRHMEYVNHRGSFDDLPLERILADFAVLYGSAFDGTDSPTSAAVADDPDFL